MPPRAGSVTLAGAVGRPGEYELGPTASLRALLELVGGMSQSAASGDARLTRVGGRKDPLWRVVVADQRSPRDGRVIETIGHYNARTNPSTIVLDEERARSWLARGAQPTDTVRKLLRIRGIEVRSGQRRGG